MIPRVNQKTFFPKAEWNLYVENELLGKNPNPFTHLYHA